MHFRDGSCRQGVGFRDLVGNLRAQRVIDFAISIGKAAALDHNADFLPALRHLFHQINGHGVENFIADEHARKRRRQGIQPFDLREVLEVFLLTRAQFTGQFDNQITIDRYAEMREFGQDVAGEFAAARAELHDLRHRLCEDRRDRLRQRRAEEWRDLGRGCKITFPAQFDGAAAVITQARRVECQRHVSRKGQPAARCRDLVGNQSAECIRRGAGVLIGLGQIHLYIVFFSDGTDDDSRQATDSAGDRIGTTHRTGDCACARQAGLGHRRALSAF